MLPLARIRNRSRGSLERKNRRGPCRAIDRLARSRALRCEDAIPPHRGRFCLIPARPLTPLTYRRALVSRGSFLLFSVLLSFFLFSRESNSVEESRDRKATAISRCSRVKYFTRDASLDIVSPFPFLFFLLTGTFNLLTVDITFRREKKIGVKCAKYFLIAPSPLASPRPAIRPIIDSGMPRFYSPLANKNN